MSRLRRFLHLEHEREPRQASAPLHPGARFETLGEPAPTAAPAPSPFEPPPVDSSGLEVATRGKDDQPFVRCVTCRTDNPPFAAECQLCGRGLHDAEQRAFNEKWWAERLLERDRTEQAREGARGEQAQAALEQARAQREYHELLAKQEGETLRAKLAREERGFGWRLRVLLGPQRGNPYRLLLAVAGLGAFVLLARRGALGALLALGLAGLGIRYWLSRRDGGS